MDGKKEPYTLSSIVAECAEIKAIAFRNKKTRQESA